jgi:hypothetical protein
MDKISQCNRSMVTRSECLGGSSKVGDVSNEDVSRWDGGEKQSGGRWRQSGRS